MSRSVNLLPIPNQRRFEHWRQGKRWLAIWSSVVVALVVTQGLLTARRGQTERNLEAAEASVAPLRRAEADARRLQAETETCRERVEASRVLEQTDATLALLQVVSDSCRDFGGAIELESLRLDESTSRKVEAGQASAPRKQLRLVGAADADNRVAAFVRRLRESQVFELVELESSQAQTDLAGARRSFHIRCEQ